MSQRDALSFIERVGNDLELQTALRALDPPDDLSPVVALARSYGFAIDEADLRAAFLADWRMRRRFYAALSREPRSAS
jgi:predicted ribosomally synthesized peptide with nif11-like leader